MIFIGWMTVLGQEREREGGGGGRERERERERERTTNDDDKLFSGVVNKHTSAF